MLVSLFHTFGTTEDFNSSYFCHQFDTFAVNFGTTIYSISSDRALWKVLQGQHGPIAGWPGIEFWKFTGTANITDLNAVFEC